MNEMLMQKNRGMQINYFPVQTAHDRQPKAAERSELVQRFRDRNDRRRRRENLFGCVIH